MRSASAFLVEARYFACLYGCLLSFCRTISSAVGLKKGNDAFSVHIVALDDRYQLQNVNPGSYLFRIV
jgi:hypothetical protein